MTTEILIHIYFAINIFFAGYYWADNYKWTNGLLEKITIIMWTLGTLFFCLIYVFGAIIIASLREICKWIDEQIQLRFWLSFYLTKKWNVLNKDILEGLNCNAYAKRNSKKLKDKIYCLSVKKINERNNLN